MSVHPSLEVCSCGSLNSHFKELWSALEVARESQAEMHSNLSLRQQRYDAQTERIQSHQPSGLQWLASR